MSTPTVLPSFWDRLRQPGKDRLHTRRTLTLAELEDAVRADVETLLNQRRPRSSGLSVAVRQTIVGYGLPELNGFDIKSQAGIEDLCLAIQDTVRMFEPRLENVTVGVAETNAPVVFRVQADFRIEPVKERIQFRAILEAGGSALKVERTGSLWT